MRVCFIEGLPGSGKSTLAEAVCAIAVRSGYDARWYLEESPDHPVHPKPWGALKNQDNFVDECLRSWADFANQCLKQETLHILEGSVFQSTVRFMMEKRQPGIQNYYRRFEEIVGVLNPRMVYLRPRDAIDHSQYVSALRSEKWTTKVSGYLANTSYSAYLGLSGVDGMHRFWADYAELCDGLVAQTSIPTRKIEFVPGEWERHMADATDFFDLKNHAYR